MNQLDIFGLMYDRYQFKDIHLIELFAGYGSQALALKYLGAKFTHHKIVEWAVNSIAAYNGMHFQDHTDYSKDIDVEDLPNILFDKGISMDYNKPMSLDQIKRKGERWQRKVYNDIVATHNLVDISRVHAKDLELRGGVDYIMTYSFPCQDLSLAGLGKGMKRDSGTRSGLLWQVERILLECKETGIMPRALLMENVPEVGGENNRESFADWCSQLTKLGYHNTMAILNAKDFGIPQNRRRCFMMSIYGEYAYSMPEPMKLEHKLKDLLEEDVPEKYYLSDKMLNCFMSDGTGNYPRRDKFLSNLNRPNQDVANSLTTINGSRATDTFVQEISNKKVRETLEQNDSVVEDVGVLDGYNRKIKTDGISTTINTGVSFRNQDYILIKNATKKGYLEATDGDGVDINSRMEHHRGTVQKGMSQTLTTGGGNDVGVVVKGEQE